MAGSLVPNIGPFSMFRGDDAVFETTFTEAIVDNDLNTFTEGSGISLAGGTVIWTLVKSGVILLQKTGLLDVDQVSNPGKFTVQIDASDTLTFETSLRANSEFKITEANGTVTHRPGPLTIINETVDPTD